MVITKKGLIGAAVLIALGAGALPAAAQPRGAAFPFEEVDTDGNGEVTSAELDAWREARFAANDTDGNGSLSVEELRAAQEQNRSGRLERMIQRADANGDGELSPSEMPGSDSSRMFDRLDRDGSGGISEAEIETAREGRGRRQGG
ncbi:EF-hand domain-containing protein [Pontivivens ytuae]|uniref:Calcium-binding protein n=1 Tax=Pontivivens ytuae TaxID=2789856 RepID=A0A7S9QC23_9RHOB|nr:calcium-binding protein [Pontivivens ytuae]QPH53375.1 calcium-binding protein [Pontivivens ytuae]